MPEAVIVSAVRTAVGKSGRGAFATTRSDDLAAAEPPMAWAIGSKLLKPL